MRVPKAVSMIYEEILRSSATTIVIPHVQHALARYELDPHILVNKELGFKIYVPEGWLITGADATSRPGPHPGEAARILILIEKSTLSRPQIELLIESIGDINFMTYFHQRLGILRMSGIEVIRQHIDEQFQVVTLELGQNKPGAARTFQVHKYFIRHGKAYTLVAALNPEHTDKEPQIINDIKQIVQSFAFIELQMRSPSPAC